MGRTTLRDRGGGHPKPLKSSTIRLTISSNRSKNSMVRWATRVELTGS